MFPLGYTAKDSSFYASLHTEFSQQNQVVSQTGMEKTLNSNATFEYRLVKNFFFRIY